MLGSFGNGGCEQISAKTVRYLSFGIVCGGVYCVTILVLRTATVRVTVFVSGFAIFLASAITLLLVLNINSSAAHFVSTSTRSTSLRIVFKAC